MPKVASRISLGHDAPLAQNRPHFAITLYGPDGRVKDERIVPNLVVNTGLNLLRNFFRANSPTTSDDLPGWIAIGTNSTPATLSDVGMGTELERESFESYTDGGTGNVVISTTFAAGVGTGAITECGIFNASSSGIMFDRSVFSVVTKEAGDTLKIAYSVTFTNA